MQEPRSIAVINDCALDPEARLRLSTRTSALFGVTPHCEGVSSDLALGGFMLNAVDGMLGTPGIVLGNVAPRDGKSTNGCPFGAFRVGDILIVTTVADHTLSIFSRFGLVKHDQVDVFNMEEVLRIQVDRGALGADEAERIARTQFRSLEFAPRLARWIWDGEQFPSKPVERIPALPPAVWHIDNFGNTKLAALPEDVDWAPGRVIHTKVGSLTCYPRLSDIPPSGTERPGNFGLIIGSSGLGSRRLLEIARSGLDGLGAAGHLDLKVGQEIF